MANIKSELTKLEKGKLVNLIVELCNKNKSVREFLQFYFQPDEHSLFQKYRDKVFEAFYPKRGFQFKLKDAKQAITEFKKFGPSTDCQADLMLFYVECGVKFTNDYGDIDENFYSSMEKMYENALELMHRESLLEKFRDRADKIVTDTSDIGWGFHDSLGDINSNYLADFRDKEPGVKNKRTPKIISHSNK